MMKKMVKRLSVTTFCNVKYQYQCKICFKYPTGCLLNINIFVGNQTIGYDHLYQGRVFSSRDDFKHHMALYALRNKFRFRHTRSSPNRMVLCCVSLKCMWRVHAIKLKNVENFEIRRVQLQHICSIDERAGNF